MPHEPHGWFEYQSSSSNLGFADFALKCDNHTAVSNGQTLSTSPPILNFWPLHASDLRYVTGTEASTGKKTRLVIGDPASPLLVLGSTFQDVYGNTYAVTGIHNETFNVRHIK